MAVIEIAKIQVRRGQAGQVGIPQLDSGEFGWAVDTQRLYIGNGSLAEGSPEIGNTEILTEHNVSNIFSFPAYVYGTSLTTSPNVEPNTGPQRNGDTTRTLFSKLDDFVTVFDFGVPPDGSKTTPDGAPVYKQIQQAIDELYLNSNKTDPISRKTLRIPAGTYAITGTVYVPPYTTLLGDGPDKTVLVVQSTVTTLIQTVDGSSTTGTYVTFAPGQTNVTSNGRPRNIRLEGITLKFDSSLSVSFTAPLLRLDCAQDTIIDNCKFVGSHVGNIASGDEYTAIDVRGQGVITTKNLVVQNTVFDSVKLAVRSNYDVEDLTFINNKFYNLYRGFQFTDALAAGNLLGPKRAKIINNSFDTIEYEAVRVSPGNSPLHTEHVVANNIFNEVGNNLAGDAGQQANVVTFETNGNVSYGNKWGRDRYMDVYGLDSTTYYSNVRGATFVSSDVAYTATVQTSLATPIVLARIPYHGTGQKINVQYIRHLQSLGISRKGDLLVNVANLPLFGNTATVTDSFSYIGASDGGITFMADLNTVTNQVRILYTSTTNLGTLEFQYSYLQ